jgi:hypothetical protein
MTYSSTLKIKSICRKEVSVYIPKTALHYIPEDGIISITKTLKTPWPQSASELYRPSNRRLLAKLVSIFADRGCYMVGTIDPHGRILGFLDRNY